MIKLKDRGDRRWFVNSQGQTFAVIEGPVEFRMGSPPTSRSAMPDETPHRRIIPRRFAIATKEVTVEQYQRFVKENPQFGIEPRTSRQYSPDPNGPMIAVTGSAAAYCNWLSEQEGLPRGPVVLPAQRAAGIRRGDDDPGRRAEAHRLSAAHRGRMGICLPRGHGHQPVLWPLSPTCWRPMPGMQANSQDMPGPAEACCPTIWACSTCLGTCMNGVRSVRRTISQEL